MAVWLSLSVSQGTPNEQTRTTTVTASVIVHYSKGSHNGNSPPGTLIINGQSFSFTCNFNYAGIGQGAITQDDGSTIACTQTVTVSYGSGSTKTVPVSASFNSGTGSGMVTASDSITLTPISSSGGSSGEDDDEEEGGDDGGGSGGISGGNWVLLPGNADVIGQAGSYHSASGYHFNGYSLHTGASIRRYSENMYPRYDILVVAFRTPKLTSPSIKVHAELQTDETNDPSPLKIALCSSDYNRYEYIGAASAVNDEHQISVGTISTYIYNNTGRIYDAILSAPGLASESIYYLIIWLPTDAQSNGTFHISEAEYHAINVICAEDGGQGVLYIDTGTKLEKYGLYIDNGTTWDAAAPYIDDGTKWNEY